MLFWSEKRAKKYTQHLPKEIIVWMRAFDTSNACVKIMALCLPWSIVLEQLIFLVKLGT